MTDFGTPVSQISGIALESVPGIPAEGRYLYVVFSNAPAILAKINKTTMNIEATYTFAAGETTPSLNGFFVYNNLAYIALQAAPGPTYGRIAIVDLDTMTRTGTIDLSGMTVAGKLICDNGVWLVGDYGYFGVVADSAPTNKLKKVDLLTNTEIATLDIGAFNGVRVKAANEIDAGTLIVGCAATPTTMKRVDLSTFTIPVADTISLSDGNQECRCIQFDSSESYCYVTGNNFYMAKVAVTGLFQQISSYTFDFGLPWYGFAHCKDVYERYLLNGDDSGTGTIRRFDISSELFDASINLTETYPVCAVTQGDYSYWGCNSSPGKIVKIRNSDLQKIDSRSYTGYNYPRIIFAY